MWIMVSGPYTSGARDDAERESNLRAMNLAAVEILEAGHVPIIGVNMALPIIQAAGSQAFDSVMMPLSLALAERCDACLRIGGPSAGADAEVLVFRRSNKPVFSSIADIPPVCPARSPLVRDPAAR